LASSFNCETTTRRSETSPPTSPYIRIFFSARPLTLFIVPTITFVHSISINPIHVVALYNTAAAVAVLLDRLALSPRKFQPTLRF
jgi:hypothetical protein